MANFFEQKDRTVIPNFRSFAKTIQLGELNHPWKDRLKQIDQSINLNLLAWDRDPSIGAAADLLSSAIVSGITNMEQIVKAAEFILTNSKIASPSQIDLAKIILQQDHKENNVTPLPRISSFLEQTNRVLLQNKIREIKNALRRFENDPILYVELARLYSILGQEEMSKKNMNIAMHLASENRYVLRSFVRLFAHYGEIEKAYEFLKKKEVVKSDPWLFSANIAIATLLGHGTRLYKQGLHLLNSNKYSASSLTELSSGLGTIELLEGSRRKSRDLFRQALDAPNDNALAQVEWALSKEHLFDLDLTKYKVERNYEAMALDSFNNQDWQKTLQYSEEWFMDMPFAKRPIMMGSHVSSVILDDQASAEIFCKAGLKAHPGNPQIINNLAYSLALANKVDDAQSLVDSIPLNTVEELSTKVCLTATQGLILFRKRDYERGRRYYSDAIKDANKIPNISYVQLALLNYAREEMLCNSSFVDTAINKVRKLKIDPKAFGVKILSERILSMYQKYSQSKS